MKQNAHPSPEGFLMQPDILELARFYKTPLGRMSCHLLRKSLAQRWDPTENRPMLGLGFATPYLWPYHPTSVVLAGMPAAQGVLRWPSQGHGRTVLLHEDALPFGAASFERILVAHALEHAYDPMALIQQLWECLTGQGELMIMVPNRLSIWARRDITPFGHGRPYSHGQLEQLTGKIGFTVLSHDYALLMPPIRAGWAVTLMPGIERLGIKLGARLGGVHLLHLRKQVFAKPRRQRARTLRDMLAKPVLNPVSQKTIQD